MKLSTLNSLLKDAPKNLKRNSTASISSIATITVALFILAMLAMFILNIRLAVIGTYSQYEISVTFNKDMKTSDRENLLNNINAEMSVTGIDLAASSKEAAAYIINVNDKTAVPKIAAMINSLEGTHIVGTKENIPPRYLSSIKLFELISLSIFLLLTLALFFLFKYTLKLSIHPRIDEIKTAQYLGATAWYIKWSFIFEGMLLGLLGALSSLLPIYFLYRLAYNELNSIFSSMTISFVSPWFVLTTISWSFTLIAVLLTALATNLVVNKLLSNK